LLTSTLGGSILYATISRSGPSPRGSPGNDPERSLRCPAHRTRQGGEKNRAGEPPCFALARLSSRSMVLTVIRLSG